MSMTASETQNETFFIQPSQIQLNFEGSIHQVQQQQTPRGLISSDISCNGDYLDEKTESKPKKILVEDSATFSKSNDGIVKSIDLKESDADILEQWKEKEKTEKIRQRRLIGKKTTQSFNCRRGCSALSHSPAPKNNIHCLSGDDGDGECNRCDTREIGSRFKEPLHENAPVNFSSQGSSPFLSRKPPKAVNTTTFSRYHSTDNLITPHPVLAMRIKRSVNILLSVTSCFPISQPRTEILSSILIRCAQTIHLHEWAPSHRIIFINNIIWRDFFF